MKYNINAMIVPDKSAGGFTLGISKTEIEKNELELFKYRLIKDYYLPEYPPIHKYYTNEIALDFVENKLTQIWLFKGYNGKLECGLGIGDYIKDFENQYGEIKERYENNFVFSNLEGMYFNLEPNIYKIFSQTGNKTDLQIMELCIYKVH